MAHLSNKPELLSNISGMLNNIPAMRNDMFAMIRTIDCRHAWQSWCVCWLRRKGSTSKGSDAQQSKSKVQLQAENSTEKQKHLQKRITCCSKYHSVDLSNMRLSNFLFTQVIFFSEVPI